MATTFESEDILVSTNCADRKYIKVIGNLLHILQAKGRLELRDQSKSAILPK